MTKDELMQLADDFAEQVQSWGYSHSRAKVERQALSDAIGAALARARSDALDEAAEACRQSEAGYEPHAAQIAADAVLRLKDVKPKRLPDIKQVMADHIKAKSIHYFPFAISINQAEKIIQEATGQTVQEQYPHCADLDTYSGVTYSDPPKGRLFMETKVVKWLIENRSADYFKRNDDIEGYPV